MVGEEGFEPPNRSRRRVSKTGKCRQGGPSGWPLFVHSVQGVQGVPSDGQYRAGGLQNISEVKENSPFPFGGSATR